MNFRRDDGTIGFGSINSYRIGVQINGFGVGLESDWVVERRRITQSHGRQLDKARIESHQGELLLNDDVTVGIGGTFHVAPFDDVDLT